MNRHDVTLMSASGNDATAMPPPIPLSTAKIPVAYARPSRGISSTATTAIKMSSVSPSGLPTACVATKNEYDGAMAPSADTRGAAHAIAIITGRRPRLSASATSGRQITMPRRTMAAPIPCPDFEILNSSAAKATVCVKSVLMNAADMEARPTKTRMRR